MTGELEFFLGREDAQARKGFFVRGLLHKNRFRKIHFARDSEHLIVGEAVPVSKYGERVALEAVVGEKIEGVEAGFHGWWYIRRGGKVLMGLGWAKVLSLVRFPVVTVELSLNRDNLHFS